MHRLIRLAALALLAACASPAPKATTYRDAGLGLYSNASFDVSRLAGDWAQVAAFAPANGADCPPGAARFAPRADGPLDLALRLCLSGREQTFSGPAEVVGPGRFVLSGADPMGLGEPWWVLWVDTDYRTLVIGTPSGRFGFILNRGGRLPQDRLTAARDILDWNGYDLTRLRVFP